MRDTTFNFFSWHIKSLKKRYRRAKTMLQIRRENPTVKIEDDVQIINPQNLILGKNVLIQKGTILHCGGKRWSNRKGKITIGDNCQIGPYSILYGAGEIEMKAGSGIAMGVQLIAQGGDLSKFEGRNLHSSALPLKFEKIVIEEGSYVGAGAIVLLGVTIGRGSIVAPGAIVHKDIPPFKMAVAPPSRIIKATPQGYINREE